MAVPKDLSTKANQETFEPEHFSHKTFEVCPESIWPHHMKNRHLLNKIQETLYTG